MADNGKPEPTSLPGAASAVGRALIAALPPAFLLLCLVNVALFYLVLSSVEHHADQRLEILNHVIDRCLKP